MRGIALQDVQEGQWGDFLVMGEQENMTPDPEYRVTEPQVISMAWGTIFSILFVGFVIGIAVGRWLL